MGWFISIVLGMLLYMFIVWLQDTNIISYHFYLVDDTITRVPEHDNNIPDLFPSITRKII